MKEYIERLTKRLDDGQAVMDCQNCELSKKYGACNALACRDRLKKRLAEYEDATDVAERKHGKWEWFEEWNPSTPDHPRECEDCGWRCGKCKTALEDMVGGYWDDPSEKPKLNFCPNCGADMRGEKHDQR